MTQSTAQHSTAQHNCSSDSRERKLPRDGYIFDYISNQEIMARPEEIQATQPYSEILVEDYNYSKEQIQTRPQFFVKKSPSDKKGSYPVDIAIFKSNDKKESELYIVVECKKHTEKDGLKQLENYLTLSTAEIGVWYNGLDAPVYIQKLIKNNGVYFEKIPNIPKNGERVEDIGLFKRNQLIVPHNLKSVFLSLRNYLAGNAIGTTRDEELAKQLINIIFTKLYDEKFKAQNEVVDFRSGINEDSKDVAKRIRDLFESVKGKYKEVIEASDAISLDDNSLYFIVGQLQNYCLMDADRDVIADAFETFIGYALKGPQGQFFTPRNVVKLMVNILNQSQEEKIIDPACGSGGFLVESLRYIWSKQDLDAKTYSWNEKALEEEKRDSAMSLIYGIEKDSLLSKVAKAYMAILGDGKGGLFCEDSLDLPNNWSMSAQQSIHLNSFDCLLANPPFGKVIKIQGEDKLAQYSLAKKWKKKNGKYVATKEVNTEMPPQVLFIERSLELIRGGGRLGVIIPETYFHAPKSQYVMNFMAQHNIYCIIDLPHNTFRPHNNAKCIAVFIEKHKKQQKNILMCVAEEMGHDHQGKEMFRWDYHTNETTKEIWDDISEIQNEILTLQNGALDNRSQNWTQSLTNKDVNNCKNIFLVDSDKVREAEVYVPRYYWQQKTESLGQLANKQNCSLVSIEDLITSKTITYFDGHGSPKSENKGKGSIPYIRVKDIVNWEVYKDPTAKIPKKVYEEMTSAGKQLQETDILYVRRGSYRIGSVAMVSPYDKEVILTREILVIRVNKDNKYSITPHYLLYLLSHWITQEQSKNKILIETTLPNIADRWKELKLPVHNNPEKIKQISKKIEAAINNKWRAVKGIQMLVDELGELTT